MSYCIKQDMIDRFGLSELSQLTGYDNSGVLDDDVLNQSIADADAEINGYLSDYVLPLTNVPANFRLIACDIARYYLYDDAMIDQVRDRYQNAIKYLVQVGKGAIPLSPDVNGNAPPSPNLAIISSMPPVFGTDISY